jgi:hypothetical protein
MRYIIESKGDQGVIGAQIQKWVESDKIDLIEKADPVVEIKDKLERVQRALETLRKAGWNKEVMEIYISKKTGLGIGHIREIISS